MSSGSKKAVSKQIGEFWSMQAEVKGLTLWDFKYILCRINKHVSGIDSPVRSEGLNQLLLSKLGGRRLGTGVSVGCGDGSLEMRILELGIVERFILFDFAEERVKKGLELAKERGLSDRMEFYTSDAFDFDFSRIPIELVHWNNSLHHMFDVYEAVKWSYDLLLPGGVFYMDEYVGPSRFRWTGYMIDIANEVLRMIPQAYSFSEEGKLGVAEVVSHADDALGNPSGELEDPSEAADSERILEAVRYYFPHAEIKNTGGLVYMLTLNFLYDRFDEDNPEHIELLKELMDIDLLYAKHPHVATLYAAALAFK